MADTQKLSPGSHSGSPFELNKAGWWDQAVQRLVLTAFWIKRSLIALNPMRSRRLLRPNLHYHWRCPLLGNTLRIFASSGNVSTLPMDAISSASRPSEIVSGTDGRR